MTHIADNAQKERMVRRWAALLREMPETGYPSFDLATLEDLCARCYNAYVAALGGDFDRLYTFVKESAAQRTNRDFGTGDALRGLWAFRDVAVAHDWSAAQLAGLDEVIWRATMAFAEVLDDVRTEHGYFSVLRSLALALDQKDKYTSCHCQSVQRIAEIIADDLGVEIGYTGLFHDIGKIHVPDEILLKPDKLTPAEYDVVKQHTVHAYRILSPLASPLPQLALQHHERPDGLGYPLGISQVPMPVAVVAVADTLHAIVSDRPYRAAKPFEEAVAIINEVKGTQLRDEPVEALNRVKEEVLREVEAA